MFNVPATWSGNDGDRDEATDAATVDGAFPPMVKITLWLEMNLREGSHRRTNLGASVSWRE